MSERMVFMMNLSEFLENWDGNTLIVIETNTEEIFCGKKGISLQRKHMKRGGECVIARRFDDLEENKGRAGEFTERGE